MKKIMVTMSMFLLAVGCRSSDTSDLNAEVKTVTIVPDCFTGLYVSQMDATRINRVGFFNGICGGDYRALNMSAYKDVVYVSSNQNISAPNKNEEGTLLVNGQQVSVQVAGRTLPIGHIQEDKVGRQIVLNSNVTFGLAVRRPGEAYHLWKYGDQTIYPDKVIWLFTPNG